MERYVHDSYTHNHASPNEIVRIIGNSLNPESIVDVGCGIGTFLNEFKKQGVKRVLGIDGPWANKELVALNLEKDEFLERNLEEPIMLNQKFDLAICVEVAEHLDARYSDILINSLVGLSNIVLFSAAIPYQEGQNHVNEQWINYWVKKFDEHGYRSFDLLRPICWDNEKIQWWYRQNMFLVINKNTPLPAGFFTGNEVPGINSYVHPDLYLKKTKQLNDILSGEQNFRFYIKLIVKKLIRLLRPDKKS
jgi:SAM-dependent methyltransferase